MVSPVDEQATPDTGHWAEGNLPCDNPICERCTVSSDDGEYVRSHYGVPAYRDGRIHFAWDGRNGTIVGFDGQYLLVLFDGDTEPSTLHPTWLVEYLTAGGVA